MEIIKGGVCFLIILFGAVFAGFGVESFRKKDISAAVGLVMMALINFAAAGFIIFP